MKMTELKSFLDEKADLYNHPAFIENDPIQIPHRFTKRQDVEIAAFLTATISWGNRKAILANATKMMNWLGNSPHEFILNFSAEELKTIEGHAVHRTFGAEDFIFFINALQRLYREQPSLQHLFLLKEGEQNFYHALYRFREVFLNGSTGHRSSKHISSTYKNASAKRLMMFLRWMVRSDNRGVDFGIWNQINPKYLSIPLDVHTGNISRKLGLVTRRQNDWKTVEELDAVLRKFNPDDPAKYDFALFGLGVSGDF